MLDFRIRSIWNQSAPCFLTRKASDTPLWLQMILCFCLLMPNPSCLCFLFCFFLNFYSGQALQTSLKILLQNELCIEMACYTTLVLGFCTGVPRLPILIKQVFMRHGWPLSMNSACAGMIHVQMPILNGLEFKLVSCVVHNCHFNIFISVLEIWPIPLPFELDKLADITGSSVLRRSTV